MSPCFLFHVLEIGDQLQRMLLGSIANIDLFVNDLTWTQAILSVWSGSIGIQSVAQLDSFNLFGLYCWVLGLQPSTPPSQVERPSIYPVEVMPSKSGASGIKKNSHLP